MPEKFHEDTLTIKRRSKDHTIKSHRRRMNWGKGKGKEMDLALLIDECSSVEKKRGDVEMTMTTSNMQWSVPILDSTYSMESRDWRDRWVEKMKSIIRQKRERGGKKREKIKRGIIEKNINVISIQNEMKYFTLTTENSLTSSFLFAISPLLSSSSATISKSPCWMDEKMLFPVN